MEIFFGQPLSKTDTAISQCEHQLQSGSALLSNSIGGQFTNHSVHLGREGLPNVPNLDGVRRKHPLLPLKDEKDNVIYPLKDRKDSVC